MILAVPPVKTAAGPELGAGFTPCEIGTRLIRFGASLTVQAHRKSRLTPSLERVLPAPRLSLVCSAAARAFRRFALEPPPRRIENARIRRGKDNRKHPP
jgi:hypothetical protein